MTHYILLLNCLDRPGIVHDITSVLLDLNANIVHADQHSSDDEHGAFFIRIEFVLNQTDNTASEIAGMVAELEDQLTAHVRCFEKINRCIVRCWLRKRTTVCKSYFTNGNQMNLTL